ncbi:flagellar motor protein MotA [Thiococcus pfennigii]|nr:flagellar motor protein MotA [Thiococcus pfennigii]
MTDQDDTTVAPVTAPVEADPSVATNAVSQGAVQPGDSALAPPPLDAVSAAASDGGAGWPDAFLMQLVGAFDAGGPVVVILAGLSMVALAIVLLKLWQFMHLRLGVGRPVDEALALWYRHEATAAIALMADQPQPVARVVHLAMTGLGRPGVDLATLREELVRVAGAQLEQLRSYLRALEIIGTLSPLLGLLGTVLGMIEAFRQLEAVGSQVDPAVLSGGIWEALLTTAVGLAVAIPVVLVHSWLERRVERCGHQMEDAVTRVFTRALGAPPGYAGEGRAPAVEVGYAT